MSTAVAERITAVIATRLAAITRANGYPIDASVTRAKRSNSTSPTDNRIYVSIDQLVPNDVLSYPSNPPVIGWDVVVRCSLISAPGEASSEAVDKFRMQAYTAMAQAVTASKDWYRFAEAGPTPLAINGKIEGPEVIRSAEQGQAGCHLLVRASFRVDQDDPTVIRS